MNGCMYGSTLHNGEPLPPLPISIQEQARPNSDDKYLHHPASSADASAYQLHRDYGNCNDPPSSGQYPYCALVLILVRQLTVAYVVCTACSGWAKRWADYRCDHQLSARPPPYSWQDDVIVLREDLSYPMSSSTISGALLRF